MATMRKFCKSLPLSRKLAPFTPPGYLSHCYAFNTTESPILCGVKYCNEGWNTCASGGGVDNKFWVIHKTKHDLIPLYSAFENRCGNTTYDSSGAGSEGEFPKWEIEVPNGKYKVSIEGYFLECGGCMIENVKLGGKQCFGEAGSNRVFDENVAFQRRTKSRKSFTHYINILDGRLTFYSIPPMTEESFVADESGDYGSWKKKILNPKCIGYLKKLVIEKDDNPQVLKPIPFPTVTKTWWQLKVEDEDEKIGMVVISPGNTNLRSPTRETNVRTRFILEGDFIGAGVEDGIFPDLNNQGFTVSVSDAPCTKTSCPAAHHVCKVVNFPNYIVKDLSTLDGWGNVVSGTEQVYECENEVEKEERCKLDCKLYRNFKWKKVKDQFSNDINKCYTGCMENLDTKTCNKVLRTNKHSLASFLYPYEVDCGGVSGKYVRVELHGEKRILDAKISVHRVKPLQRHLDKWPKAW